MKRLLRLLVTLAVLAAIAAIVSRLRQRSAASPQAGLPGGEPPRPATPALAPADPDDLTRVWGIGPVYRARLAEAGISTFAGLAAADPASVAEATGVPPNRVADWIAQAAALAGR